MGFNLLLGIRVVRRWPPSRNVDAASETLLHVSRSTLHRHRLTLWIAECDERCWRVTLHVFQFLDVVSPHITGSPVWQRQGDKLAQLLAKRIQGIRCSRLDSCHCVFLSGHDWQRAKIFDSGISFQPGQSLSIGRHRPCTSQAFDTNDRLIRTLVCVGRHSSTVPRYSPRWMQKLTTPPVHRKSRTRAGSVHFSIDRCSPAATFRCRELGSMS